ncbi:MAG: hypothetical protein HKM24_00820 [Gammaproteobacteria bacterium]|nr:hypothetical protein [Gammaproteobacteria bacterium]
MINKAIFKRSSFLLLGAASMCAATLALAEMNDTSTNTMTTQSTVVPNIDVSLAVEKKHLVEGEAVNFNINVTNLRQRAVNVPMPDAFSSALTLMITDAHTGESLGQQTPDQRWIKELESTWAATEMVTLAANERVSSSGDLATWSGGNLPAGAYQIQAVYSASDSATWYSPTVTVNVDRPSPTKLTVAGAPASIDAPRVSAWLNASNNAYDVFLMQSSHENPGVTVAQTMVATVRQPIDILASSTPSSVQSHLVWIDEQGADSSLAILPISENHQTGELLNVSLPSTDFTPVNPPLTTIDGGLATVMINTAGTQGLYIKVSPSTGRLSRTKFTLSEAVNQPLSLTWSADQSFDLIWTGDDGQSVYHIVGGKADASSSIAQRVFLSPAPVVSLKMIDSNAKQLAVLGYDTERFELWQTVIDLAENRVIASKLHDMPTMTGLAVLQAELNALGEVAYLFGDDAGHVYFAAPEQLSDLTLIEDTIGNLVTQDMQPTLLSAADGTVTGAFHIRYIQARRGFSTLQVY